MGVVALSVKRAKRGVHHVTYTDGGVENYSMRFVVRHELPSGEAATVELMHEILQTMPEDRGVYAVYEGPLGASTATVTGRLHPKIVSVVITVTGLLIERCQQCPPDRVNALVREFNEAAYQMFRSNFPPIQELARSLKAGSALP